MACGRPLKGAPMFDKLILDDNRFFDSDPTVRGIAWELYANVKDLPIVSPHGHCDPAWFSENPPFPNPTELIVDGLISNPTNR